ncbi:hypothetical protein GCM10009734_12900 [Nonomuraea bangladeshensis]
MLSVDGMVLRERQQVRNDAAPGGSTPGAAGTPGAAETPGAGGTRRVSAAVAAGGLSSFALLYAPQPVLPQLAEGFRLDPGSASLAVGVATGALAVAVLPVAALAERVGRRRVIVWSVLVSAVLGLLLPLAPTFPVLLGMRAVQGVAIAGFAGVAAAYLADALGTKRLAAAVGAMIAGNSVGGMLGRLGTGFAAAPLGWHGSLAVVAAVALACALFAALTLPRADTGVGKGASTAAGTNASTGARAGASTGAGASTSTSTSAGAGAGAGASAGAGARQEDAAGGARGALGVGVWVPCAVGALAMGAFVALYNAAGFRLAAPPLSLAPAAASLVFLSYAMGTVSSAAAGRLAGRFGRTAALVTALLVTVAGSALTLHPALPVIALGFAVLTAGFFAAHAIANAWVTAQASPRTRGRAAGLYTLCYYLGSGAGGTVGSVVYGRAGWPWLIALTTAWLLLAASPSSSPAAALRRSRTAAAGSPQRQHAGDGRALAGHRAHRDRAARGGEGGPHGRDLRPTLVHGQARAVVADRHAQAAVATGHRDRHERDRRRLTSGQRQGLTERGRHGAGGPRRDVARRQGPRLDGDPRPPRPLGQAAPHLRREPAGGPVRRFVRDPAGHGGLLDAAPPLPGGAGASMRGAVLRRR